ncbi:MULTISPECIES: TetR/AcrR family transcriptional regulator [unclassified Saccharothrix]|uniref:TetR/AcrR family transcriptional regulator n=1 Tax=unclassified Saccharothrix TaxID=2593673 RepID=UPI00307DC374
MPRQVDHAARLAAVTDAVVAIAAERGFAAVTIRAVADRMGASTSVVTHYVPGRDELLRTAVRRELAVRRAQAERAMMDGPNALWALVRWAVADTGDQVHRFWLSLLIAAPAEPVLRAELDDFNAWWDAHLRGLVARSGVADPEVVADTLDVVVDGLVTAGFEDLDPARRDRVLTRVWRALGLG